MKAIELRNLLIQELKVDTPEADTITAILLDLIDPADLPQMEKILHGFKYHTPDEHHVKMLALDLLTNGHGLENQRLPSQDSSLFNDDDRQLANENFDLSRHECDVSFVNMGDMYNATLISSGDSFYLTTLGDAIEAVERSVYLDMNNPDGSDEYGLNSIQALPKESSEINQNKDKVFVVNSTITIEDKFYDEDNDFESKKIEMEDTIEACSILDAINKAEIDFKIIEKNANMNGKKATLVIDSVDLSLQATLNLQSPAIAIESRSLESMGI